MFKLNGVELSGDWKKWPTEFTAATSLKQAPPVENNAVRSVTIGKDSVASQDPKTGKEVIRMGPGAGWREIQDALRIDPSRFR